MKTKTPQPRRNSGAAGFTLLELLIALSIFAVVSLMAFEGIAAILRAEERIGAQQERLREIDRAIALIARDFQDIAPRRVRLADDEVQAPLVLDGRARRVLLTRSGWSNPAELKRSGFQRVRYEVANQTLSRSYWLTLDPAGNDPAIVAPLLDRVVDFEVRVRAAGEWTDTWPQEVAVAVPAPVDPNAPQVVPQPPTTETEVEEPRLLPEAIEVTMEVEDFGRIRRLVVIEPETEKP